MENTDFKEIKDAGSKDLVFKEIKSFDFTSKTALMGAVGGLAYAIIKNKSKLLFVSIGALAGAILDRYIQKHN
jgi:hypothetical protein